MLFPSKSMRDWQKFSWKKGDVLVSNDSKKEVIFDGFVTIDYTCFKGKHFLDCTDESNHKYKEKIQLFTDSYNIEEEDASKCFINTIEERLGGKLNPNTLKVEKTKPEFKDGDIVVSHGVKKKGKYTFITRGYANKEYWRNAYVFYMAGASWIGGTDVVLSDVECPTNLREWRYATDEEKQKLFSALEKEDKKWNADTKQIEDIKPKWTPKPFDRVLYKNGEYINPCWICGFFCHQNEEGCNFVIGCEVAVADILPYNEQTAHLIGTTDDYNE